MVIAPATTGMLMIGPRQGSLVCRHHFVDELFAVVGPFPGLRVGETWMMMGGVTAGFDDLGLDV